MPYKPQYIIAEEYINFLADNKLPFAMTKEEVLEATENDTTLQKVKEMIVFDKWHEIEQNNDKVIDTNELKILRRQKSKLSATKDGIVLRGHQILLLTKLRKKAIVIAHESHMGMTKTKQLLRERVYFPGLDQGVEAAVKGCLPCQASTNENQMEPLQMSELPDGAWKELSTDLFGPFPTGHSLLVVMDDYSRYPEVKILKSTTAETIIPKLDEIFSTHGIPETLKSDNGPAYNSHKMKIFAQTLGFKHKRITPYLPRANGEIERFMRTLKKMMRTAIIDRKDWKQHLNSILRNYRAKPHSSTKRSPADLLFRQRIKTKLPTITSKKKERDHDMAVKEIDRNSKKIMKTNADKINHAKEIDIKVGDTVLAKHQLRQNKLEPTYDEKPFIVKERKGSMVTANRNDKTVTRNASQFKKISDDLYYEDVDNADDDDEDITVSESLVGEYVPNPSVP